MVRNEDGGGSSEAIGTILSATDGHGEMPRIKIKQKVWEPPAGLGRPD